MSESANHRIAQEFRTAAMQPDAVAEVMNRTGITALALQQMMLVSADIIDIYDAGGVDVNEWPAAKLLIELLAGGKLFPPGQLPPPPKPTLYVAKGNDKQLRRSTA